MKILKRNIIKIKINKWIHNKLILKKTNQSIQLINKIYKKIIQILKLEINPKLVHYQRLFNKIRTITLMETLVNLILQDQQRKNVLLKKFLKNLVQN